MPRRVRAGLFAAALLLAGCAGAPGRAGGNGEGADGETAPPGATLTVAEVRALAKVRDLDSALDAARLSVYSFVPRYQRDPRRHDRIFAEAGLDYPSFAALLVKVQAILADRERVLEPYDRMREAAGGGMAAPGDPAPADRMRAVAARAEEVRADCGLLARYGFVTSMTLEGE